MLAASAAVIFARLAMMQEMNPFLWGALAVVVYAGAPTYMIWRGARWLDAPWVWASSFLGLFALFVLQSVLASRKRFGGRGGPPSAGGKGKKPVKGKGKGKGGMRAGPRPGGGPPEY